MADTKAGETTPPLKPEQQASTQEDPAAPGLVPAADRATADTTSETTKEPKSQPELLGTTTTAPPAGATEAASNIIPSGPTDVTGQPVDTSKAPEPELLATTTTAPSAGAEAAAATSNIIPPEPTTENVPRKSIETSKDAEPKLAGTATTAPPDASAASAANSIPPEQTKISRKPVASQRFEVDKSKPEDFEGEVLTNNEIPSPETIKKIEDYIVLDKDGRSHAFKTLYSGPNVARRVLMIFIRHFFCGNCQEYIRSLSEAITPESLLGLPVSTFIVIIGCGDPSFIESYARDTNCRFPIYTDPRRSLFDALGMKQTLAMGSKPAYMKRPMSTSVFQSVLQGLRAIPTGNVLKAGNQRQVGGEFLFEPLDLVTPVTTPQDEKRHNFSPGEVEKGQAAPAEVDEADAAVEPKRVSWCHRMKSTRDHCEIPELQEVLGLVDLGAPSDDKEKWAAALQKRQGTGESMARAMSQLSHENRDRMEDRR